LRYFLDATEIDVIVHSIDLFLSQRREKAISLVHSVVGLLMESKVMRDFTVVDHLSASLLVPIVQNPLLFSREIGLKAMKDFLKLSDENKPTLIAVNKVEESIDVSPFIS
jgi:hypothetical protein